MRTETYEHVIAMYPERIRLIEDEIAEGPDTSESDGTGDIQVRCSTTVERLTARSVKFHHVTVEIAEGYDGWTKHDLMMRAVEMLSRDYIEAQDGSGEVAFTNAFYGETITRVG